MSKVLASEILLKSPDGTNPLGFLAALGAFRILQRAQPENRLRMRWVRESGWRPVIAGISGSEEEIAARIHRNGSVPYDLLEQLGKDITVEPTVFRQFAKAAFGSAVEIGRAHV